MLKAYVTNTDSDDISVVDLDKKKEITRVSIGGSPRGSVRFDPQKNFGYVSNCAGNTISVIDLNRDREVSKITVGLAPRGLIISNDGNYAFVSNSGENTLSVVDLLERKEVKKIAMGENPRHMSYLAETNRLLVAQWGSDSIANLDLTKGAININPLPAIPVGNGARPYSISSTKDGSVAYVANTQSDYVSVINVNQSKEITRIKVGYGGRAIVLSDDQKFAFVSVENSNEVVVIDTTKYIVIKRIDVGPSPRGIAISKSRFLLCTASFSRSGSTFGDIARNSISVINIKNPKSAKLIGHIKVGLGPCSISILE